MAAKRKASDKELGAWIKACEAQGFDVQDVDDGWKVKNPARKDVPPMVVHTTYSDHRSKKNVLARLRRAGLTWPPPKKHGKGA